MQHDAKAIDKNWNLKQNKSLYQASVLQDLHMKQ